MARDYFLTVSSSPGTLVGSGSGKDNQQQLYSHIVQFVLIRIISQFSYNIQLISINIIDKFYSSYQANIAYRLKTLI